MNFVHVLVSALLALGAAVNFGSSQRLPSTTAAVSAAAPTPTPTPAPPTHYDVIGAGGPT